MNTRIKSFLLSAFVLGFALSFVSCTDNDDSGGGIIGKWYHYQTIEVETENGVTETDTWTYNAQADQYYSAELYEITSGSITAYFNASGSQYDHETMQYRISGNEIIIENENDSIENETIVFAVEGDMLTFIFSETDDSYSYTSTAKFKRYTGDIPPANWIVALQNDSYEPDNTYMEATQINMGSTQSHVTIAGDIDWFKFNATVGTTYLIKVSGYLDGYMRLFDTTGENQIASDDDNNWDVDVETTYWGNPVILWSCPSTGTYYFNVTGFDEEDEGYYSVDINTSTLVPAAEKTVKPKHKRSLPFIK